MKPTTLSNDSTVFPKYSIIINDTEKFLPFAEAFMTYGSPSNNVRIGPTVIEKGGKSRQMTRVDKARLSGTARFYDILQ